MAQIYTLLAYKELPTAVKYCLEKNKGYNITYLSEKDMYDKLPFLEGDKFTIQQKSDILRYYLLSNEPCWWVDATVEIKDGSIFDNPDFELCGKHDEGSLEGVGVNNFWDIDNRITIDSFIEQSLTPLKQKIYGDIYRNLLEALKINSNRDYLYSFSVKNQAYRDNNYSPEFTFVSADTATAMGIEGDSTYFIKHTAKIPDFLEKEGQDWLKEQERKMAKWLKK